LARLVAENRVSDIQITSANDRSTRRKYTSAPNSTATAATAETTIRSSDADRRSEPSESLHHAGHRIKGEEALAIPWESSVPFV